MRTPPDWDLLIVAVDELQDYDHFPAKIRDCKNLLSLEGMRFRDAYLTSRAIETGSANLFHTLYFNARISGGRVLHISDWEPA